MYDGKKVASRFDTWYMNTMKTTYAVYEHGVFRPLEAVELPERAEVEFEPRPVTGKEETCHELDGLYAILGERYQSGEIDVAARHNQHQP